jgi:hypothetical protein
MQDRLILGKMQGGWQDFDATNYFHKKNKLILIKKRMSVR